MRQVFRNILRHIRCFSSCCRGKLVIAYVVNSGRSASVVVEVEEVVEAAVAAAEYAEAKRRAD